MDNTELRDLAKQAVTLPGWRWWWTSEAMPLKGVEWYRRANVLVVAELVTLHHEAGLLPDLSHPATGGIMLEMLGEGWVVENVGIGYSVYNHSVIGVFCYKHFAEACVRAAIKLGRWPEAS